MPSNRQQDTVRVDGYAPIRDYAAVGDGRTVALVAMDGSIDWLGFPDLDSPAVLAALLDADDGGRFELCPDDPFTASRRYLSGTNVVETTFETATGAVRVIDAMTRPGRRLGPQRELVRQVEGVSGSVGMRWAFTPRFGFGGPTTRITWRGKTPVASCGSDAIAVRTWDAGDPEIAGRTIRGRFDAVGGSRSVLALCGAHQEPLVLPNLEDVSERLQDTISWWQNWSASLRPVGAWSDQVQRSALVLELLVQAPAGSIAAAATTSLPETLGGDRNWDYRYCWVRDSAFVLTAFLGLGRAGEAEAFFWWLMQASQLTHPRLQVLYRLDGGPRAVERSLPLAGYRRSAPVRIGNGAASQLQLDVYGDLLETAWLYTRAGKTIDADIGRRLAEVADLVCAIWHQPDAGLWEVRSGPQHFTQSKMMCAIALDRASAMARVGLLPSRHLSRWKSESAAIRRFVDNECWSDDRRSYVRHAGSTEIDASLLLGIVFGYGEPSDERLRGTVDAVRRELSSGPFVYRYLGEDGLEGDEGAFLACSFWLVEAMAAIGRTEEAADLMGSLVGMANDVGLFSEEVDPTTGEFLGNMPQALTHLALIRAAMALDAGEAT